MSLWTWLTGGKNAGSDVKFKANNDKKVPGGHSKIAGRLKQLVAELLRALRKDHRKLQKGHKGLARRHKKLAGSLDEVSSQIEELSGRFETLDEGLVERIADLEETAERIEGGRKQGLRGFTKELEAVKKQIERLRKGPPSPHEEVVELVKALLEKQSEITDRLDAVREQVDGEDTGSDMDLLKAVGGMVQDDDRLLAKASELAENCPEDCFADTFTEEVTSRLRGMRSERVSLLAANDIQLIDTAEDFDPSRHQAVGTVPRSNGETGEARIERVGLLYRDGEEKTVVQPALVSVFEDVETNVSSGERG